MAVASNVARTKEQASAGLSVSEARAINHPGTAPKSGKDLPPVTTYTLPPDTVDTNYQLRPGESTADYYARVDKYNVAKNVLAAPVSTLSSTQGKKVVDTKITPVITTGTTAATAAQTMQQTNAAAGAAQSQAQQDTPADMYDDPLQAEAADIKRQRDAIFKRDQQRFNELMIANTAETKGLVQSLNASWEQDRQDQELANTSQEAVFNQAGVRTGQSRYAPTLQGNLIAAVRTEGLRKIQNINAKYTAAIAEANAALKTNNLSVALKASASADAYLKEAQDELKTQLEKADKVREKQVQATRDQAIAGLVAQGVEDPNEILTALQEASEASGYGDSDFTLEEVGNALKYFEKSVVTSSDGKGNLFGIDKNTGKLVWQLAGVSNPENGTGGGDSSAFGPEDKRQISQAGLANADERTRSIFINTPDKFRQEYIRNGFGNPEVTPAILLKNLEEWEAIQDDSEEEDLFG